MKPLIVAILSLLLLIKATAQDIDQYTAANGITYHVHDTVHLGKGSAVNGDFLYLQTGGWKAVTGKNASASHDSNNVGRAYAHTSLVIKKIRKYTLKGTGKVALITKGIFYNDYILLVNDAIEACEVTPCATASPEAAATANNAGIADQLIKLKDLLDKGAITEEEYAAAKKKLLGL